ncbi:MAG: AAA family ATPase [Prevotellaceae bacterium]|nr:AAA family ATPase [Prevotellaceae bacterium]
MKKIIIKDLTLKNWRGDRNRTTTFSPTKTTISGANGLGKSRHFDAFMWLLFGKDRYDRKDFNVKTTVGGHTLERTNSEVAATLTVDGEELTLRRVLAEKWVKPRGAVTEVFKGNETECYWNETPVSVTEYNGRIKGLIDDLVFKLVTNPDFFCSLHWTKQREQLFTLAGTVDDEQIAATNDKFKALLDSVKGKGFEDFKKELSARKKRLKNDLSEINPRIDQTIQMMPTEADFTAIEAEIKEAEAAIEENEKALADKATRQEMQFAAITQQGKEIQALKGRRQKIVFDEETKAREEAFNANAARRDRTEEINGIKRALQRYAEETDAAAASIRRYETQLESVKSKMDALRNEWYDVNAQTYKGETTCSHCGQELPTEKQAAAKEHWEQHKENRLNEITERGKRYNAEREEIENQIAKAEKDKRTIEELVEKKTEELRQMETELAGMQEATQRKVIAEEIAEYQELSKQITTLEEKLKEEKAAIDTADTDDLRARNQVLRSQRDEAKKRLADRDRIEMCKKQIADLEEKGKTLAQKIADAEQEEFVISQFTRVKIEECEKRINSLFENVTFKLFDFTIEDVKKENPVEVCVPYVNGVPYETVNTAGRENAGLEIIKVLQRFYGVEAPVFCDNAERVNRYTEMDNQMIFLKVTDDKELTITY